MMSAMTAFRFFPVSMAWMSRLLLATGSILVLQTTGFAQDAAPLPNPTTPIESEDEQADENVGTDEEAERGDPRAKAAAEEARQLRIKRQTEITSSLPTEGGLLSSLAIPEGLVGDRGVRYGNFIVSSSLILATAYTDNAEAADDERDDDLSVSATGTARAQSLLARHQLGLDASATSSHSFQEDNDDYFDWVVGADGRLDLTRKSSILGTVDYSLDTEDDSSSDAGGSANDIEAINGNVGYEFSGNKFGYLLNVGARRQDFSGDGSADRDNTTYEINQRLGHRTTPRLSLFVSPQYSYTKFDRESADDGEGRNAHLATGLIGGDLTFRSPVTLSAAVGYARLFFEDPDREDTDSIIASSTLNWQASPLTSLELSASHALELTTLDDADARTDTAIALGVSRQVGLNTSLLGELGATYTDFRDIDRNDIDLRAGIGLARRLTDHLFFSLAYQYEQRLSEEDGSDFYENQALMGLSIIY